MHRIRFNTPKIGGSWFGIFKLNLKWLQLREIDVTEIENGAFSQLIFWNLEYLEIFDVPLKILKSGTFNRLRLLKLLSMSGLKLNKIEKNVLDPMNNLEGFMLIQCGDEKISLDNFFGASKLFNLKIIAVQQCDLSDTITNRTFTSIPAIKTLSLSSNNIQTIGPRSFDSVLKTVQFIHLGWNSLKSIPNGLFKTNRSVSIDFTDNPLHCDCKMEHLRIFEEITNNVNFSNIICYSPDKYHGIPLRNCPDLCEEISTSILNTEKPPIRLIWNDDEEQPIREQNQNEVFEREYAKLGFMCKILSTPQIKKMFKLTKSSHEYSPVSQNDNGELLIDTALLSNYIKLIELNHIQSEFDEIILNNEQGCSIFISSHMNDIQAKRRMELNTLYRFCWMDINLKTIFPLNCVTFHSGLNNSGKFGSKFEKEDLSAWILVEKMPIMIVCCILSAIFSVFIGIFIAIILAKVFPKKIQGRKSDLMKSMAKIGRTIAPREEEAYNRLKYVFD